MASNDPLNSQSSETESKISKRFTEKTGSVQRRKSSTRVTQETSPRISRSCSEGPSKEKKILNVESKYDEFFSVSQVFENILNELQTNQNHEEVCKKLLHIQSLISSKISSFKQRIRKTSSNQSLNLIKDNTDISGSTLSLCSDESEINCLDDNPFMNQFLLKVNCPFCRKSLADKINLIKHLDKNCEPHLNKKFEKSKHVPFSVFQILPNNSFKCNICPNSVQRNLKKYVVHLNSDNHVLALLKASKTKYYSEYLFCSCCKIQVANNYTEIDFHIRHRVHNSRSEMGPNLDVYLLMGIHCVYVRNKKFKCLDCFHSRSWFDTPKEILRHFEEPKHMKSLKLKPLIYCEFCCKKVHIFEIMNHLNGKEHKQNVEGAADKVESFELCFYCGFVCNDLMALSLHMETKCDAINDIREKDPKIEKDEGTNSPHREIEIAENAKEEHNIIVKDYTEVPKLYKYFMKFGQILTIEVHKEKDVKIQFKEKNSVDDILLLKNVLKVDGVKLEITTIDENRIKSDKSISESSETTKSFDGNMKTNDETSDIDDSNSFDSVPLNNELQILFKKVSTHLMNNAQKPVSKSMERIAEDCARSLQVEMCELVGFMKCGLSFPVETISFYCSVFMSDDLLRRLAVQMINSELWDDVTLSFDNCFPYIKCTHKETQKTCTVTISQSAKTLTNMLSKCLESNRYIQSFCLIIRFWLSVHELKIREFEYVIISIIVYFLTSEKIVDVSLSEYYNSNTSLLENIVLGKFEFKKPSWSFDVKELFQKFLVFLNKFDFENFAICLPIQCPVPKIVLVNKVKLKLSLSDSDRLIKNRMCIMDPDLKTDTAEHISEEDKNSFLKIVRSTIKHYNIQ